MLLSIQAIEVLIDSKNGGPSFGVLFDHVSEVVNEACNVVGDITPGVGFPVSLTSNT